MGTEEILISVIIPFYKGEKYIEETIKSIVQQPYKNIEILIINDGSPDNSVQICKAIAEQYSNVKYFDKENEGIGATRNFGILKATGKYLAFLDQDDVWVNGFLDDDTINQIKNGGDMIGFSYYRCNHNFTRGKAVRVKNAVIDGGGIKAVESSWNHHSSFFFNRQLIIDNTIKCPNTRHEDEIFRHMCQYVSRRITYVDREMFMYRNNPASETHRRQSIESLYGPILDSWNQLLNWHIKNHTQDVAAIRHCKNMICIYGIEAIEHMYQTGVSNAKIQNNIQEYLYGDVLEQYEEFVLSEGTKKRIEGYYNNRFKFVVRHRIKGMILNIIKQILRIPQMRRVLDTKRYPIVLGEISE